MFVYEVNGWGFESRCCHLNLRYAAYIEQEVPWYSGKRWSVDSLWNLYVDIIITYSQDLFTQLRPSGIIWDKISLHFIRIRFLNVGTVCIFLSLLFVAVVSFYFGIKQLQCKTNTIPVYICYSWFNSWLLLFLILYSCYLLFLLVILVILIFDPYTRVYWLFLIWCGYIFPSINKPDIEITTIY